MNGKLVAAFTFLFTLLLVQLSVAQDTPEVPCSEASVVSVPSRPTISNSTETTHCGILEAEAGGERLWLGGDPRQEIVSFGARLGLSRNLDVHWQAGSYLNIVDSDGGSRAGFGESWIGAKYRFLKQGRVRPSIGLFYEVKIPTHDRADAFGTARFDHALSVLVSRDVEKLHVDFNVVELLAGRPSLQGHDDNTGFALSGALALPLHFSLVVETYGTTLLNTSNPAFASLMFGITYQVTPRLMLDFGDSRGLTGSAPQEGISGGITLAVRNIFSALR